MRQVKVFEWKRPEGEGANRLPHVKAEKCYATFHQFGVDYEEFESGPGNFSVAIVEYSDGTVDLVPAHLIQFIEEK